MIYYQRDCLLFKGNVLMWEGHEFSHRRLGVFSMAGNSSLKRDMPSRPRMLSVNLLSCFLTITGGWLLSHDSHVFLNHCLQKHFPPLSFKWSIPLQNSYVSSCSSLKFAWSPILSLPWILLLMFSILLHKAMEDSIWIFRLSFQLSLTLTITALMCPEVWMVMVTWSAKLFWNRKQMDRRNS